MASRTARISSAGETVAVLGAAGGAGLAAVEIAKLMGARVIAVASSPEKLAVTREHGADEAVELRRVRSQGGPARADRRPRRRRRLRLRRRRRPRRRRCAPSRGTGGFLVVGFASGDIPKIPLNLLLLKGCAAIGVFWGEAVKRDPEGHRANMRQVLDWVAEGRAATRASTRPIRSPTSARRIAVLDRREAVGKVVLTL